MSRATTGRLTAPFPIRRRSSYAGADAGQPLRRVVLLVLLAAGAWLLAAARQAPAPGVTRWPQEDGVYAVDGWLTGPPSLQQAWGVTHVRRDLRRTEGAAGTPGPTGTTASVLVSASPTGKGVFGNADVALLGAGYALTPAPAGLVPAGRPQTAVLARGPDGVWLVLYTYGQRHGWIGGAVQGWGRVLLDTALARPNDYYLVRVLTRVGDPTGPVDARAVRETAALADTLIGRIAGWYAG